MGLEYVSASAVRNWFAEDPLLDWLDLLGEEKGFVKDNDLPDYDPDVQMSEFLFKKGREFEQRVVEMLRERCDIVTVEAYDREEAAIKTEELIREGVSAIYQGWLIDPTTQTGGRPDLIVRSDMLSRLCIDPVNDVGDKLHYRVVDIKFKTLKLNKNGSVGNGKDRTKKAQLLIYNRALAAVQNYLAPTAYLIGRGTEYRGDRYDHCLQKLVPADVSEPELADEVDQAIHWIRRVRQDGASWNVLPKPDVEELRPNASNTQDSPWHSAKREIVAELKDLSALWYVSPKKRPKAISRGIERWDDARCNADIFEISDRYTNTLQKILDTQVPGAPNLSPDRIQAERQVWHPKPSLEFFVDFETVSNLDDKFERFPETGGQPLIFMVGCGYERDGEWEFKCFTVDRLNEADEAKIIGEWMAYMGSLSKSFGVENPIVYHWSPAERVTLDTAFNAARARHPNNSWPHPNWFDFLGKVMKAEPVTIKGALAFGLKVVAKAMLMNDMIRTRWEDGPADGLGAMVGAWNCDAKAELSGGKLLDFELMKDIRSYNETDCKVMWEVINYLRKHH